MHLRIVAAHRRQRPRLTPHCDVQVPRICYTSHAVRHLPGRTLRPLSSQRLRASRVRCPHAYASMAAARSAHRLRYPTRTCQQLNYTTSSPTQTPNYTSCGLGRSGLQVAPASLVPARSSSSWRPGGLGREATPSHDQSQAVRRSRSHARRHLRATHSRPQPAWFSILTCMHVLRSLSCAANPRVLLLNPDHCPALVKAPCANDNEGSHALRLSTRATSVRVIPEAEFRWTHGRKPRRCYRRSRSLPQAAVELASTQEPAAVSLHLDTYITGLRAGRRYSPSHCSSM